MDKWIDIELIDERLMIRFLKSPTEKSQLLEFFDLHEGKLQEIKTQNKTRFYIDLSALTFNPQFLIHIPVIVSHFLKLQPVSEVKLRACSVYVSTTYIASIIQPLIDAHPGTIPTFVSADENLCKQFLRQFK